MGTCSRQEQGWLLERPLLHLIAVLAASTGRIVGPKLPKDTRLRVLDKVNDIERRGLSLYPVEVAADHTLGYAYLRSKELARQCPLIWPSEANLEVNTSFARDKIYEEDPCLNRGPANSLVGLLLPACRKERRQLDRGQKLDVDGDGRLDRLVEVNGQLAMVRDTAAGWTADVVAALGKYSFREEVQWLKPVQAGAREVKARGECQMLPAL